jgi:hypothetical protein
MRWRCLPAVLLAVAAAGCGTSSKTSPHQTGASAASRAPSGPIEHLAPQASEQVLAAGSTILGLAENVRKAQLRAFVARYEGASDEEVRNEVLKQIAKSSPEVVNRGQFGEPTSLNQAHLRTQLTGGSEQPGEGQATAARTIDEIMGLVRGAGFQTLVGASAEPVGTLGGPESVPQVLDNAIANLSRAGLPAEAGRLRRFEKTLPSAPGSASAAYANEIEHIAHVANTATASAVSGGAASGQQYGTRVESVAQKLELSPPPTYAADVAAPPLDGDLKALAVSVGVVGVVPSRLPLLSQQIEAVDAAAARALTALGTGAGVAHHTAYSGRPVPLQPPAATATSTTPTTSESEPAHCGSTETLHNLEAAKVSCAVAKAALETMQGSPCGPRLLRLETPYVFECGQSGVEGLPNNGEVKCTRQETIVSCEVLEGEREIGRVNATLP